jgi:hypothetical protein
MGFFAGSAFKPSICTWQCPKNRPAWLAGTVVASGAEGDPQAARFPRCNIDCLDGFPADPENHCFGRIVVPLMPAVAAFGPPI